MTTGVSGDVRHPRLSSPRTNTLGVTFVVPTYNSERTIEACVRSLVAQGDEVIVVDNDSQDDTRKKAAACGARVVVGGPERSAQRNLGLSLARTDVVCFVDCDQKLEPGTADELRACFGSDPGLVGVVLPERSHGEGYLARCRDLEKRLIEAAGGRAESARAFRTGVLRDAGGYRTDLNAFEDAELHDRIGRRGRMERAASRAWHDEGHVRPVRLFRKKLYYGRDLAAFTRGVGMRHTLSRLTVLGVLRRKAFTIDPPALPGLLFLKLIDLAGLACGAVAGAIASRDAKARPRRRRVQPPRAHRLHAVLTYAVPALLVVLATFAWYDPGTFVASGDVGPFYREALRANVFRDWGYTTTGAGSRIAEGPRVLEVGIATVGDAIGASPEVAQQTVYAVLLVLAATSVVFCLRQIQPGSSVTAAVPALVAVASPLVLTSLPNPLVIVTLGAVAAATGVLVRVAAGGHVALWAVALAGLPFAAVGQNPAYLASTLFGVVTAGGYVAAAHGRQGLRRVALWSARAVPLLLLVHAWWIVPSAQHYAGSMNRLVAQTDVMGWSWTHANASIGRLLTTTAHWGWDEYYAWTDRLSSLPYSALLWIVPLSALSAPVLVRSGRARRIAFAACAIAVVALFLAKGLHPPLQVMNLWLYEHVPGFWVFREPVSKFGPVMLLAATIGFSIFLAHVRHELESVRRQQARVAMVLLCGAVLLPGLPLYSGLVAPPHGVGRLPSARVRVPEAWERVADRLNTDERPGKLLVLPLVPFYQMPTKWNYYGVADLPRQLVKRPVLMEFPGGYFSATGAHAALLQEAERRLQSGRLDGFARLLDGLGVSHVLVRRDYGPPLTSVELAEPDRLIEALAGTELFEPAEPFGVATVFTRRWVPAAVQSFDRLAHVSSSTTQGIARFVTRLPYETAAVTSGAPRRTGALDLRVDDPGTYTASLETEGGIPYDAHVMDRDGDANLELHPAFRLVVDGDQRVSPPAMEADIPDDRGLVGLEVGSDLFPVADRMRVSLLPRTSLRALTTHGDASPLRAWSPVADCNDDDDRDAGLSMAIGREITLRASRHSACTWAPIRGRGTGIYSISFEHRTVRGAGSRVCLWLVQRHRCSGSLRFAPSTTWKRATMLVRIPPGELGRMYLYADTEPGAPTVKQFRGVVARRVERGEPLDAPLAAIDEQLELGRTSSVREEVVPLTPDFAAAQFGNCNVASGASGLGMRRLGEDGVQLRARLGSACVSIPLPSVVGGRTYRISLEHRSLRGASGRVCVWLDGVNRCAAHVLLPRERDFRPATIEFDALEATTGVRLYLYADGVQGAETVAEYRAVRLEQVVIYTISVPSGARREASTTSSEVLAVERDRIRFRMFAARRATSIIALPDSADAGWRLEGVPATAKVTPVVVDGYRQGWRVDHAGSFEGRIEFAPADAGRWSRVMSVLSLWFVLAGAVATKVGRRRRTIVASLLRITRRLARRTKLHKEMFGAAHRVVARLAVGPGDERGLREVDWRGARILVPAHDVTILPSLMYGEYESVECDVLAAMCRPGMTVVDAGANVGLHTILLSRAVGETGRVHAFEPEIDNVRILDENVRNNGCTNVRVHPFALGSRNATAVLHVSSRDTGTHTLVTDRVQPPTEEIVEVRRLHDVLADATIDVLKIDVEGWEGRVLLGAVNLLERRAPLLMFEFDPRSPTRRELVALVNQYWEVHYAVHPRRRRVTQVRSDDWHTLPFTNVFAVPARSLDEFEQTLSVLGIRDQRRST